MSGAVLSQEDRMDIYLRQVNLPADIDPAAIRTISSDSLGYLWFGTNHGLYRWDGQYALHFVPSATHLSTRVTAIAHGRGGRVWAGCNDGSIFYVSNRKVHLWRNADTSSFEGINDILLDSLGRLWWGTNGSGIYFFNGKRAIQITAEDGLPDDYVYNLERGMNNEVWVSTDNGIAKVIAGEESHEIRVFGRAEGLPDNIVRSVRSDSKGNLWLGFHNGGINRYLRRENTFRAASDIISGRIDHMEIAGNSMWVIEKETGLVHLSLYPEPKVARVVLSGQHLERQIRMTHVDNQGNLWLLGNEGLYVSSGGAFSRIETFNGYPLADISVMATNETNDLFVADHDIVYKLSGKNTEPLLQGFLPASSTITDMQIDREGVIWLATFGQGVVMLDPETRKIRNLTTENAGLVNNSVLGVYTGENEIWIATLGGASCIKKNSEGLYADLVIQSYNNESGLSNNFIYQVLQDAKGNTWFATDGNGLVKFDGSGFTFYDESSELGDDVVYSLDVDEHGTIWLSTSTSGVFSFNGESFLQFDLFVPGMVGEIYSLACSHGYVVVLAESGLYILDIATGAVTGIDEELDLRKVRAQLNCAFKTAEKVMFPTSEGVIEVVTSRLANYRLSPVAVIDRTMVNLLPVEYLDNSSLSSDENQLVFEYTGHWYLAPDKVRYNIQLEGYETDWQTTYDRRASYASLPYGKYNFKLTAFIDQVQESSLVHEIHFTILKPIYLQWWFILFCVLALFAGFYGFLLFREKRLRLSEARKKEKLEFEFQTLKNQINPHFLFNSFSTLISMIEENPGQAVEYADKLSDFFRNILEVKDRELVPLSEELDMLKNYFFIQKNRFGDSLDLELELEEGIMQTLIPPLSLQLLIENALIHNIISRGKPLTIKLQHDDHSINVSNNLQPKKNQDSSTGLGLKNIKDRYQIISGKQIQVTESETEFTVALPILRDKK